MTVLIHAVDFTGENRELTEAEARAVINEHLRWLMRRARERHVCDDESPIGQFVKMHPTKRAQFRINHRFCR